MSMFYFSDFSSPHTFSLDYTVYIFCGSFVLWKFCGSFVEVLWKFCGSFVEVLWKFCGSFVEVLWKFCGSFVEVLWKTPYIILIVYLMCVQSMANGLRHSKNSVGHIYLKG
jgi:hypothetical protein